MGLKKRDKTSGAIPNAVDAAANDVTNQCDAKTVTHNDSVSCAKTTAGAGRRIPGEKRSGGGSARVVGEVSRMLYVTNATYATTISTATTVRTIDVGAKDAPMTNAKVNANNPRPKRVERMPTRTLQSPLESRVRVSAMIPTTAKTAVESMNGAPRTAPIPTAWLARSRSTTSATNAIAVSGKDDPMAAITEPTAPRAKPYSAPTHSTALVKASLARTSKTSALMAPMAMSTGRATLPGAHTSHAAMRIVAQRSGP